MKRFLTIFPPCENIHLTKDVGMIPYMLYKTCKYDATIASYNNDGYPNLDLELSGLKQSFISKIFNNRTIDSFIYLLSNFRRFDILQVYHFSNESLMILVFFKLLKFYDRRAITYLKLDVDETIKNYKFKGISGRIKKWLVSKIDVVTIESRLLFKLLNDKNILGRKVQYIPNGFYDKGIKTYTDFSAKANVILTVGRIGTHQKSNETLLMAFKEFCKMNSEWTLEIVGPVEPDFQKYIDQYFEENIKIKDRIKFKGAVWDRELLLEQYRRAKIFVLTSRWEGFPLVFLEAMKMGCTIISTNVPSGYDVTNSEKYGSLFPVGDINALTDLMIKYANSDQVLKYNCDAIQEYAYDNFYWPLIASEIDKTLRNHQ